MSLLDLLFMFTALGASDAAPPLPPPFDKLVATVVRGNFIYARPGALRPAKACGAGSVCFEIVLEEKAAPLCLAWDAGPSGDPTFLVLPREACSGKPASAEPLLDVGATTLVVPGNGLVYSAGHTNNFFNARRKFEVRGGKIREVRQPYFYVGGVRRVQRPPHLDPKEPLAPIVLRSEKKDSADVVATVTEGGEVEVLLSDEPSSGWFIVRTSFGLVGWYHSTSQSLMQDALGIYFNGD